MRVALILLLGAICATAQLATPTPKLKFEWTNSDREELWGKIWSTTPAKSGHIAQPLTPDEIQGEIRTLDGRRWRLRWELIEEKKP